VLAHLPGTLAADTLPKFFNDFTRVAHLNIWVLQFFI
jgi:hypothetical protein